VSADTTELRDLDADTVVIETDRGFRANLNPVWNTFGPCGGYLAAIALRAAGALSKRARPSSISCTFLTAAEFGAIDISVRYIAQRKRSSAIGVVLSQGEKQIMEATVWAIDSGLSGIEHDASPRPDVEAPENLTSLWDLVPAGPTGLFSGIQTVVEERALMYDDARNRRLRGAPHILSWMRFHPVPYFEDVYLDAGRLAILVDLYTLPAAGLAHETTPPYFASSLDLVVHFHHPPREQEWLLCDTTAPWANYGLLNGRAKVWARDGALLASGGQQMLCRPAPAEWVSAVAASRARASSASGQMPSDAVP
jgi:acyl-CoA thioesterase II